MTFPRFLEATWVAPASGPTLLRLQLNCDVVAYADVQADGCYMNHGGIMCDRTRDGTYNSVCSSELLLTVTPGAYFEQQDTTGSEHHRRAQSEGDNLHQTVDEHAPTHGTVQRTDIVRVSRTDVETQAATVWLNTPADQRTAAPPTLDDMMVSDTEANRILASLFTVAVQPHVVFPLKLALDTTPANSGDGHRRHLQAGDDRLVVDYETHAPSAGDADSAENRLIEKLPGAVRAAHHAQRLCDLSARTQAVNDECCNEPTEDCSAGVPATCNAACAAVVLPFFDDCSDALGQYASQFDDVVALCRAALGGKGRRLRSTSNRRRVQMGDDDLTHNTEPHAVCGLGSSDRGCTIDGQTRQQGRLVIQRDDIEAIARNKLAARTLDQQAAPPTLVEMLVSGTPANALLASLIVDEQQPQIAFPVGFALDTQGAVGRRQLQAGGDQLLQVTLETHAATPAEAERIVRRLVPSSSECSDSCELHGTCDRGICTCGDGYSGDACLALVDECFEVDCGSQGSCSRGLCVCGEGYSGVHCETRDNARPVSPVCTDTRDHCAQVIASGFMTCAADLSANSVMAGLCDLTCGFCSPSSPPPPDSDGGR